MTGKPASRISDAVANGVIVQGSLTVLIGSEGGVACSVCPGGKAVEPVGSPVNPALGAKVLARETDFALPSAAVPLVWSRTYSSYVNAEHGGACGVLGHGWYLSTSDMRLDLQAERTLFFDPSGRTITFPEPLLPGVVLHSSSENIWLLRGGENASWADEAAWRHIPPEWASAPACVILTSGNKSQFLRFAQLSGQSIWLLVERRDHFGNSQHRYTWLPLPSDQPNGAPPSMLLGEIDDGVGRRYRLHYLSLYPARPATGPGWRGQAGWQADNGWRLIQVELLNASDGDSSLSGPARKAFKIAQTALKHPNIPDAQGIILVRYEYDKRTGDLIRVRDRANIVTREFSTRNHLMVSHRYRGGLLHRYEYEALEPGAKVVHQYNEGGLDYHFTYFEDEPGHSRTVVRDSLEREQTYTFEGEGGLKRLVKHQRADGSFMLQEFNIAGHLTCVTDSAGRKVKMFRDGDGRLIDYEDPAHRHFRGIYDELGHLTEVEDASGHVTRFQYDSWGRRVGITYSDGTHEAAQYPEPETGMTDLPVRIIDARGGVKHLEWDSMGQLISYTDCSNKTTRYRYSFWGRPLSETNVLNQSIHFERDHTDKLLSITLPDGGIVRCEYDAQDRLIGTTAPGGIRQSFAWDSNSRLIEYTNAAGYHLRCQRDLAGRIIALENQNGACARFEYDIMDRLTREIGFDHRVLRYRYNLLGQLTDKTEESLPTRPMIRYDYDEVGNLTARHLPANGPIQPLTERFEWDKDEQMTSAFGFGGKIEFKYDHRGRLRGETQTQVHLDGRIWQWKHRHEVNELGVMRQSTYGELPPIEWLTYGSGHLHGISLPGFSIDFERDDLHREISRNVRTAHAKLLFFNDTTYNALGNISERVLEIDGTEHERKQYRYDPLARLIEIDDALGVRIQYTYDKAGRLTGSRHGAQTFQYIFDAAGNRIDPKALIPDQGPEDWAETVRKRFNDPDFNPLSYSGQFARHASHQWIDNRITELDGIQNTYDGAGNLIWQKRPDGTTIELAYDGAFRLAALTRTNPDGTQVKAWYGYDAFSRRIAKGVTEHGVEKITSYGWDGEKLAHEATEETFTTIIYAPGSFVPLMRIEQDAKKEEKSEYEQAKQEALKLVEGMLAANGMELKKPHVNPGKLRVSFFVTDHAGTPCKLIDEKGKIIWRAEPDDWAAVRNERGIRQPIRFQGQWLDEESGFYYNQYRYYDPKLGRYITQDPIGLPGGMNVYAYPLNPVTWVDPLGLKVSICGSGEFIKKTKGYLDDLSRDPDLKGRLETLKKSGNTHYVNESVNKGGGFNAAILDSSGKETGSTLSVYDPNQKGHTSEADLAHELLGHAWAKDQGKHVAENDGKCGTTPPSEKHSMEAQHLAEKLYYGKIINETYYANVSPFGKGFLNFLGAKITCCPGGCEKDDDKKKLSGSTPAPDNQNKLDDKNCEEL